MAPQQGAAAPVPGAPNPPPPAPAAAVPAAPAPQPAPAAAQPAPAAAAPGVPGAAAPVQPAAPAPVQPAAPAPAKPAAQAPARGPSKPWTGPKIALNVGAPATVNSGQQFNVDIKASSAQDLYNAVFVVTYDPKVLQVVTQSEGNFLNKDGGATSFQAFAANKRGELWISTSRLGPTGITGSGTLASVLFQASGKGQGAIGFSNTNFSTKAGDQVPVTPFKSVVEVK